MRRRVAPHGVDRSLVPNATSRFFIARLGPGQRSERTLETSSLGLRLFVEAPG
jgi:hypothetical protein